MSSTVLHSAAQKTTIYSLYYSDSEPALSIILILAGVTLDDVPDQPFVRRVSAGAREERALERPLNLRLMDGIELRLERRYVALRCFELLLSCSNTLLGAVGFKYSARCVELQLGLGKLHLQARVEGQRDSDIELWFSGGARADRVVICHWSLEAAGRKRRRDDCRR